MPTKYFALNKSNTIANLKYLPSNTCFLSLKSTTMAEILSFIADKVLFLSPQQNLKSHNGILFFFNFNYFQHSVSLVVEKVLLKGLTASVNFGINCLLKTMCDSATWLFLEIKLFKTIYIWIYLETKTTPALELKLQ